MTQIISFGNSKVVAKIYDARTKSASRLRFEIDLLAELQSQSLPFEIPTFKEALPQKRDKQFDFHGRERLNLCREQS